MPIVSTIELVLATFNVSFVVGLRSKLLDTNLVIFELRATIPYPLCLVNNPRALTAFEL